MLPEIKARESQIWDLAIDCDWSWGFCLTQLALITFLEVHANPPSGLPDPDLTFPLHTLPGNKCNPPGWGEGGSQISLQSRYFSGNLTGVISQLHRAANQSVVKTWNMSGALTPSLSMYTCISEWNGSHRLFRKVCHAVTLICGSCGYIITMHLL